MTDKRFVVSLLFSLLRLCISQTTEVQVGMFYYQELAPQLFNSTGERVSVHYSISSEPFAGLPAWLNFYQRNSSTPGILYGTPTIRDIGRLDVQVIAINRNTFDNLVVIVSIDVAEYVAKTDYSIDLFITNNNFDGILMGGTLTSLTTVIQTVLQSPDLLVESVVHPTFRGDSLPLPTKDNVYEGVYVIFGNVREGYERASSDNITAVMETCSQSDMDLSNLPQLFYSAQPFDIDWCKMILIRKDSEDTTASSTTQSVAETGTTADDSTSRNIAIVISFLILFVVVIIISYLVIGFCYNRYQTQRRVDESGKRYKKKEFRKDAQSLTLASAQMELRQLSFSPPPDYPTSGVLTTPSPTSSIDGWRFDDPPPYQYPLHLIQSPPPLNDELTLEPATATTLL
ncbi:epsilon-sarcoglycan-like [Dysidea avara]|uniref:epsilon-sarcoglycan-like n=1 Tax=Dysidea avara TaxID=196820 RepID=UPI00332187B1